MTREIDFQGIPDMQEIPVFEKAQTPPFRAGLIMGEAYGEIEIDATGGAAARGLVVGGERKIVIRSSRKLLSSDCGYLRIVK
jgi:hypothetical protein